LGFAAAAGPGLLIALCCLPRPSPPPTHPTQLPAPPNLPPNLPPAPARRPPRGRRWMSRRRPRCASTRTTPVRRSCRWGAGRGGGGRWEGAVWRAGGAVCGAGRRWPGRDAVGAAWPCAPLCLGLPPTPPYAPFNTSPSLPPPSTKQKKPPRPCGPPTAGSWAPSRAAPPPLPTSWPVGHTARARARLSPGLLVPGLRPTAHLTVCCGCAGAAGHQS
jgi:hypothetical protein